LVAVSVAGARFFLGNAVPLDPDQVRISGKTVYADTGKAVRELGVPQTPFRMAVQHAYDWYNKHGYLRQG
jgi:dihydroflavonol-4-reductase